MTAYKSSLSFVPERLPDQTLYSWTAMFHILSGGSSVFETCKTLFGSSEAGRHFHIPSHLDSFCELTRSVLGSPEEVISTATIIPFYTQFRHPRVASEILEKVRGAQIAGVAQTLGVYAIGQHSFLQHKACVECVREDFNEFGFSYWHRAHQLPCTLVCHKHGTLLFGVAVEHRHSRRESFIFPTVDSSDSANLVEHQIRTNEHDLLSRMAEIPVDEATHMPLAFDHTQILAAAVVRLRGKVEYTSLPAFLLAEPFTLPKLQRTYEVVLGRAMDKSAFRKRMLDANFLEEAGATDGLQGRVAMAYRIKDRAQAVTFPRMFRSGE